MVNFESLFREVHSVLQMKTKDFENQGVRNITEETVWQYLLEKKWKDHDEEDLRMYKIVSDIFSLSKDQIVVYQQQGTVIDDAPIIELNADEIAALLEE